MDDYGNARQTRKRRARMERVQEASALLGLSFPLALAQKKAKTRLDDTPPRARRRSRSPSPRSSLLPLRVAAYLLYQTRLHVAAPACVSGRQLCRRDRQIYSHPKRSAWAASLAMLSGGCGSGRHGETKTEPNNGDGGAFVSQNLGASLLEPSDLPRPSRGRLTPATGSCTGFLPWFLAIVCLPS